MSSALPLIAFREADTVRLISTAYIDEPAIAPLYDDDAERDVLERLEGETSGRISRAHIPDDVAPAELLNASYGWGWSYINAAFCHTRAGGNRFNDEERGAWYCGWGKNAAQTVQAEVGFHRTRALREAGCYEDVGAYRELRADFMCSMHDIRAEKHHPALEADPADAYPAGKALAARLRSEKSNGLLYPSARNANGQCAVAFRPNIIQNLRQGTLVTFTWRGSETPSVVAQ